MNGRYSFEGQEQVISPQLVYYKDIIQKNVEQMIALAGGPERLWPHVKTHKMLEMVKLQMDYGIRRFKCATIAEAQMCGEAKAAQAVVAYPLIGPNQDRFFELKKAYPDTQFYAIEDDTEQVRLLGETAVRAGTNAALLMDVDMGQHRTGVPFSEAAKAYREWARIPGIRMCGFHCYDGHRHETDYGVREELVKEEDRSVESIKAELEQDGLDCSIVIMGGTPSFPCHKKLTQEYLSPGTCVVQDAGYQAAYPDLAFVPGAAVLTRVISRPGECEFTLDLGTKAVASDPAGERAVLAGMEYASTVIQNEEHWVVRVPKEHKDDIPPIGTVMFAIPVHICPTSALYPEVPVISQGKIADWWEVTARNRKITI
ncbi:MAG: D-TA family PLP-dependent enzyme [Blautia sp.]